MDLLKITKILCLNALFIVLPLNASAFSFENAKNIKSEKSLLEESATEYQLLYFWATWCPDCKEKLRSDLKNYNSSTIEFKTINIEKDLAKIKKFVSDNNINYPIYYDESKKLQKELSVFSVPTAVLIQKNSQGLKKILQVSGKSWDEIDTFIKNNTLK